MADHIANWTCPVSRKKIQSNIGLKKNHLVGANGTKANNRDIMNMWIAKAAEK